MAFTPFVESDLPTMANFNEKFLEAIAEGAAQGIAGAPKIATGSYVGTGSNGANNTNRLTFDFEPQALVISLPGNSYYGHRVWVRGVEEGLTHMTASTIYEVLLTWEGNTVIWYTTNGNADAQLNASGSTYLYLAIG